MVVTDDTPAVPGGDGEKLDTDGKIDGGDPNQDNDKAALRVLSDMGGQIYLRLMSFGDYNGNRWSEAEEYSKLLDGKYSFNYLTGVALKASGFESGTPCASIPWAGIIYCRIIWKPRP